MKLAIRHLTGWPVLLTALFLVMFGARIVECAGRLEGWLFPVTTQAVISDVQDVGNNRIDIYGNVEKLRDCEFVELRVYFGRPDTAHFLVPIRFLDGQVIRPPGSFNFGPWRISLAPRHFKNNAYIEAIHNCHPLYPTITKLYLPEPL